MNPEEITENMDETAMIPSGILTGFEDDREISIGDLTVEGFWFRRAEKCEKPDCFRLYFYDLEKAQYREIKIEQFTFSEKKYACYYICYVTTNEQKYQKEVVRFIGQYNKYVQLKMEDDGILARELTGYPAEKDLCYKSSLEEQKRQWFQGMEGLKSGNLFTETALELDRPDLYEKYLQKDIDSFLEEYRKENHLPLWIWEEYRPDRIYVGNQFCHLLFPEKEKLLKILKKASRESLNVTVSFAYMREYMTESAREILKELDNWGGSAEVVINDWGMLQILKENTQNLRPSLGILLNKQRKDPRMKYKKGDGNLLSQNSIHADFYREYLEKEYKVSRYEWEACSHVLEFPKGGNSLHIPFYQTNTSQYCPLYAALAKGDRGQQKLLKKCPGYCEKYGFLYPEHLEMTGRYNSLFALDSEVLQTSGKLEEYRKAGADRLVMNFL